MKSRMGWSLLLVANALCYCVLSFYQTSNAAAQSRPAVEPFANSVQQRIETIAVLKEIKELLQQQNALLQSGKLKVIVSEPEKQ